MQKLLTDIGKKSKKAINNRLSTKKKNKVLKDYRLLILKNKKFIASIGLLIVWILLMIIHLPQVI